MNTLILIGIFAFSTIYSTQAAGIGQYVEGKYQLASDPDAKEFVEYLKAIDVSSENIEKFKKISSWDVVKLSDNSVQYKVSTPHFAKEFEVEFGKLQDDTFLDGQPYKSLYHVSGNQVSEELIFPTVTAKCQYICKAEGVDMTCTAKGITSGRFYKRVA